MLEGVDYTTKFVRLNDANNTCVNKNKRYKCFSATK